MSGHCHLFIYVHREQRPRLSKDERTPGVPRPPAARARAVSPGWVLHSPLQVPGRTRRGLHLGDSPPEPAGAGASRAGSGGGGRGTAGSPWVDGGRGGRGDVQPTSAPPPLPPPPPPPPRRPAGASGGARRTWPGQRKPGTTGAGPCSPSRHPRPRWGRGERSPSGETEAPGGVCGIAGSVLPRASVLLPVPSSWNIRKGSVKCSQNKGIQTRDGNPHPQLLVARKPAQRCCEQWRNRPRWVSAESLAQRRAARAFGPERAAEDGGTGVRRQVPSQNWVSREPFLLSPKHALTATSELVSASQNR